MSSGMLSEQQRHYILCVLVYRMLCMNLCIWEILCSRMMLWYFTCDARCLSSSTSTIHFIEMKATAKHKRTIIKFHVQFFLLSFLSVWNLTNDSTEKRMHAENGRSDRFGMWTLLAPKIFCFNFILPVRNAFTLAKLNRFTDWPYFLRKSSIEHLFPFIEAFF